MNTTKAMVHYTSALIFLSSGKGEGRSYLNKIDKEYIEVVIIFLSSLISMRFQNDLSGKK